MRAEGSAPPGRATTGDASRRRRADARRHAGAPAGGGEGSHEAAPGPPPSAAPSAGAALARGRRCEVRGGGRVGSRCASFGFGKCRILGRDRKAARRPRPNCDALRIAIRLFAPDEDSAPRARPTHRPAVGLASSHQRGRSAADHPVAAAPRVGPLRASLASCAPLAPEHMKVMHAGEGGQRASSSPRTARFRHGEIIR